MKTTLLLPLIAAGLAQVLSAQTETYDIATFVPPRGFQRLPNEGVLVFDDSRPHDGRPAELCQIVLFPSKPATGSPLENFQSEWEDKIVKRQAGTTRPQPQTSTIPGGWTALAATVDIPLGNMNLHHLLVATSGFGRVMSLEVVAAGGAHQAQIQDFLKNLRFRSDSPGPGRISQNPNRANPGAQIDPSSAASAPAASSAGGYIFAPPNGWTRQQSGNGITIVSPAYSNGERCQINMLPLRPAGRSLPDDTINIFRQTFRADPLTSYPSPPPKLTHGVSPQGWEYFIVKKSMGQEGDSRTFGAVVMTAKLGSQMAVIVATSKDFLTSNCMGELVRDSWPAFFYSLRFENAPAAPDQQAAIQQRLAGTWMMATGSVGLRYVFNANGRYQGAGGAQQRTAISSTEILQTTQAYFGDGAYSFDGNRIVLAGDDGRRSTKLFRVGEESRDSGRTWQGQMCMLDEGASGEVCYRKE